MRYSKFTIENYKGIQNTSLDLTGRMEPNIYCLVGLNESGKTTILEALKFLKDGTDSSTLSAASLIPRRKRASFTGVVCVKAELLLSDNDKSHFSKFVTDSGYKDVTIGDRVTFSRSYHFEQSNFSGEDTEMSIEVFATKKNSQKAAHLLEEGKAPDLFEKIEADLLKKLPSVVYYSDFLYSIPDKIYIDASASVKPVQKFYRSVIDDILSSSKIDLTLEDLASRIASPKKDHVDQVSAAVNQMGALVTRAVFSKWNEIFGRKHEDKRIIIKTGVEKPDKESPAAVYVEIKLVDGSDEFHIEERSLGFRWFFAFLLLTIFRKNRAEDQEEILYLLDEPASNLHPTAQRKILETVKTLGEGNSKLIYTTHSHFLINPEWLEGAFIVKNHALDSDDPLYGDSEETDIKAIKYRQFAAEHPDQTEYFQPILHTLDYQPSNLEVVDPIVVTEGKFDFYVYTYLQKHHFNQYSRFNFYPGGGAGSNSGPIALYLAWSKKVVVLLDSDSAGTKAKEKYFDRFGEIFMEPKCITYEDVMDSWKGKETEDLFNKSDLLSIQQTLYPTDAEYDKSHFNEAMQKLLIDKKSITLGVKTLQNFEKVFEKLEELFNAQ